MTKCEVANAILEPMSLRQSGPCSGGIRGPALVASFTANAHCFMCVFVLFCRHDEKGEAAPDYYSLC